MSEFDILDKCAGFRRMARKWRVARTRSRMRPRLVQPVASSEYSRHGGIQAFQSLRRCRVDIGPRALSTFRIGWYLACAALILCRMFRSLRL